MKTFIGILLAILCVLSAPLFADEPAKGGRKQVERGMSGGKYGLSYEEHRPGQGKIRTAPKGAGSKDQLY
ncbi:MAG: hypothetical protein J5758_00860, partial [Abditibacteriota bacterium]|nr:hypothetical protein [Abditibacteriota bacterium]